MPEEIDPNTDQLTQYRDICKEKLTKFTDLLDECSDRVNSKPGTLETCHQEMVDFVVALDHCALPKAFKSLK